MEEETEEEEEEEVLVVERIREEGRKLEANGRDGGRGT